MSKRAFVYTCVYYLFKITISFAQTGNKSADQFIDSARSYLYSDQIKSYAFIQKIDSIAKNENINVASAYVHHLKGIIDEQIGDNKSALSNYLTGIEIANRSKDKKAKLKISIALSNYYINRSDFQKCITTCQDGIKEAISISDFETAGQFYNNLSLCHSYLQDYEKALTYSDKSIEMKEKGKDEESLANSYLNKGLIFTNKFDYKNGFEYYAKAEAIYLKHLNNVSLTQTYINYGWDYTDLKKYKIARKYLDKALYHAELSKDKIRQAGVWNTLGYYYKNAGYKDSITYALEKGLQYSLEAENKRNVLIAYKELANHYQSIGKQNLAFEYLNKAFLLKDSIFEKTKIQQTQLLNVRFESLQKEEQINLLNAQRKNDKLTIQKQRLILFSILLIIAITALVIYLLFNRYKRKQKERKEIELQYQRENERMRIARDMHDEIGAGLTRIVMRTEQVKLSLLSNNSLINGVEESLLKMGAESRQLSHNIGEIIWALNPKNDTFDALCAYIRNYAYDYLEEAGITCNIHFPESIPTIPITTELRRNVFLILKESLNNILKHSESTEVEIDLTITDNNFSITIKDNGKGIENINSLSRGNGMGNMKKRAEDSGAIINIDSNEGAGLKISVNNIPFKNPTKV